ncbi:unnamed protein product [Closterium sp. Yama58-4]|nr:unnamed protein product [Closterium sp. Yama58-4]
MEIARTSMIHARAPHFLWPYAVHYAAHQLNLWPRVSQQGVSPTSLWTGSPGVASEFQVWGCLALVRDTSADKLLARAVPCVFLGFPYPCQGLPVSPPPLFLAPLLLRYLLLLLLPPLLLRYTRPPGPALSDVSHATPLPSVAHQVPSPSPQSSPQSPWQPSALPREVAVDYGGVGFRGTGTGGASSEGVGAEGTGTRGASSEGAGAEGTGVGGASSGGTCAKGAGTGGASSGGARAGDTSSGGAGAEGASSEETGAGGATPPPHR